MFKKIADKLTKPATPKTLDEMLENGGRLYFHVPVTDEKGRVLSVEEVNELYRRNALAKIANHERTIAKAAGLGNPSELESEMAACRAKQNQAREKWELMQRRFCGGVAEMSEVMEARSVFDAAASFTHKVGAELLKVKEAEEARAEIGRLRAEYKL